MWLAWWLGCVRDAPRGEQIGNEGTPPVTVPNTSVNVGGAWLVTGGDPDGAVRIGDEPGHRCGAGLGLAELDGDGVPDLLLACLDDIDLSAWTLDGRRLGALGVPDPPGGRTLRGSAVGVLGDLDGDGIDELGWGVHGDGTLRILDGATLADDPRGDEVGWAVAGAGEAAAPPIGVADLDGDGVGDVAVAVGGELVVLSGARLGAGVDVAFADVRIAAAPFGDPIVRWGRVGDVDGDGLDDLAVVDGEAEGQRVRLVSVATLGIVASLESPHRGRSPLARVADAGDLDGDGDDDLVLGFGAEPEGSDLGSVGWYGAPDLAVRESFDTDLPPTAVEACDVDADGFADLVAIDGHRAPDWLTVRPAAGAEAWWRLDGAGGDVLCVPDLDGDAVPELLVGAPEFAVPIE